ncbi:MAG: DUF3226 domain-containing protein [Terriglobales bacterium]
MKSAKFNKFILSTDVPLRRTSPYVIVCEGLADAGFVSALLVHRKISGYEVGCPSQKIRGGQGKDKIVKYLEALAADPKGLQGVLVVVDTDSSASRIFKQMVRAFESVDPLLPIPKKPFTVEGTSPRSAIFLMPGKGKKGTLEHLLLEAVFKKSPKLKKCLNSFEQCTGKLKSWPQNKKAKARTTMLTAAHCKGNPASSLAWIWAEKGNPVPIGSSCFDSLSTFLSEFVK